MSAGLTVKEYLTALKENRLLGMKCRECGSVTAPPRLACRKCGSYESEVIELSGKGRVATFTSVHVATESRRGHTPYCVVLVELEEGPWIMGNLVGADPSCLTLDLIGRPVKIEMPSSPETKDGIAPQFKVID